MNPRSSPTIPREFPISIDDKGHVIQVRLAERCVRSSRTVMALKCENGILLLCELEDPASLNRIVSVSANILAAGSGFPGDVLFLLNKAEILADAYRMKFDQDMPLDEFVLQVSDLISLNTIRKTVRPFRASLVIAGWDPSGYHVYVINPDGQTSLWSAVAIGRNALTCNVEYEKEIDRIAGQSLRFAKKMGVDIYRTTVSADLDRLQMVWLKRVDQRIDVVTVRREEIDGIVQGHM